MPDRPSSAHTARSAAALVPPTPSFQPRISPSEPAIAPTKSPTEPTRPPSDSPRRPTAPLSASLSRNRRAWANPRWAATAKSRRPWAAPETSPDALARGSLPRVRPSTNCEKTPLASSASFPRTPSAEESASNAPHSSALLLNRFM